MSPATGTGQRSRNASRIGRRDAALALLAGDVDLDEHAQLRRRVALELLEHAVGGDGVDEAHERRDLLDLAALQLPDEVPRERVAVRIDLRDEVLRAVLPGDGEAGLGEHAELCGGDVLHGGDDLDLAGIAPGARGGGGDALADLARGSRATRSAVRPVISWANRLRAR